MFVCLIILQAMVARRCWPCDVNQHSCSRLNHFSSRGGVAASPLGDLGKAEKLEFRRPSGLSAHELHSVTASTGCPRW